MPIYPGRRKGTHRVVVWAKGTQHEEICEGTKAQAREHEARLRIELRAKATRTIVRIAPLFSDFSQQEFQPHARTKVGPNTWRRFTRYNLATLVLFFGPHRLDALTVAMVDAFIADRSRTLSASTLNKELVTLRQILAYAKTLGRSVADIAIPRLRETERRVRAWTVADVQRLLVSVGKVDARLVPMVVFLVNTGCRKGEMLAARWEWVDLRRRILSIGPSADWAPKSKKPREVPISDALAELLRTLPKESAFIFPNAHGTQRIDFLNSEFAKAVRDAELEGGAHTLRHTFASLFLASGGSLWQLSAILGHTLSRTTELYAHMLPGHLEAARNIVNVSPKPWRPTMAKRVSSGNH